LAQTGGKHFRHYVSYRPKADVTAERPDAILGKMADRSLKVSDPATYECS
jgi:hypothetical protein